MAPNWPLHQLLAIEGTTVGGDIWATTLKTIWGPSPGLQLSFADQETLLKSTEDPPVIGLWDAVRTWWTAIAGGSQGAFCLNLSLVAVKFNSIGHDGKYVFPDTSEFVYTPSVPGPSGAGGDPRQSLVQTLRPAYDRGRGAYGRMYPPVRDISYPSGQSMIADTSATATMNVTIALIQAINAKSIGGQALTVCNISPGDGVRPSITAPVTRVEVDRVMDTQRRRTNKIPRTIVSGTV